MIRPRCHRSAKRLRGNRDDARMATERGHRLRRHDRQYGNCQPYNDRLYASGYHLLIVFYPWQCDLTLHERLTRHLAVELLTRAVDFRTFPGAESTNSGDVF